MNLFSIRIRRGQRYVYRLKSPPEVAPRSWSEFPQDLLPQLAQIVNADDSNRRHAREWRAYFRDRLAEMDAEAACLRSYAEAFERALGEAEL